MILLRRANSRGFSDHGWLRSWHSFSFADYYDPAELRWGALRVINDDVVAPGGGFGKHSHRNMEIVTYLLSGALEHRDSLGSNGVLQRPEIQRMSAGSGIEHSEFNASDSEELHLLQIWIEPDVRDIPPEYEYKTFEDEAKRNRWCLLASPDGAENSLTLYQNARMHASLLAAGCSLEYACAPQRRLYLHVVCGLVGIDGFQLGDGDAAKISGETKLSIDALRDSELLLFDLP